MNVTEDGDNGTASRTDPRGSLGYLNFSTPFTAFILSGFIVTIVAAIIGNILVCVAMFVNPHLRKATTSLFIFSLAISDLLTASLSIPFDVDNVLNNGLWSFNEGLCILWTTTYLITVPTSNLTLLVLSTDRYLSLVHPRNHFRGKQFMTRTRVALLIVVLWIFSVLSALLPLGWTPLRFRVHSLAAGICVFNISRNYSLVISTVHFVLPSLAMAVIYFLIYRQIQHIAKTVHPADSPATRPPQEKIHVQRNIRAAKRIAVIASVFFMCWVPYSVLSFIANLIPSYNATTIPLEVFYVTLMMGYLNCALNPFLYSFNNRNFMDTYKRLFRAARKMLRPKK